MGWIKTTQPQKCIKMETENKIIENVKNIKLSERTKQILIALATFNESFWKVSELLTEKSDDEETQEVFDNIAGKEQEKAREYQAKAFKELENLAKEKMFQTFFETEYREI